MAHTRTHRETPPPTLLDESSSDLSSVPDILEDPMEPPPKLTGKNKRIGENVKVNKKREQQKEGAKGKKARKGKEEENTREKGDEPDKMKKKKAAGTKKLPAKGSGTKDSEPNKRQQSSTAAVSGQVKTTTTGSSSTQNASTRIGPLSRLELRKQQKRDIRARERAAKAEAPAQAQAPTPSEPSERAPDPEKEAEAEMEGEPTGRPIKAIDSNAIPASNSAKFNGKGKGGAEFERIQGDGEEADTPPSKSSRGRTPSISIGPTTERDPSPNTQARRLATNIVTLTQQSLRVSQDFTYFMRAMKTNANDLIAKNAEDILVRSMQRYVASPTVKGRMVGDGEDGRIEGDEAEEDGRPSKRARFVEREEQERVKSRKGGRNRKLSDAKRKKKS